MTIMSKTISSISSPLKYALVIVSAMFLSSGAVVAAFLDETVAVGDSIMWLIAPTTALLLSAAYINHRWLTPGWLLEKRYGAYLALALLVSYCVPLFGIGIEYVARELLGYGHRIHDYLSPWILADTLCSATLVLLLLAGMSFAVLFKRWKAQSNEERRLAEEIDERIAMIRERLNPAYISSCIDGIASVAAENPDEATVRIGSLSAYLRHHLYELSTPDNKNKEAEHMSQPAGQEKSGHLSLRWLLTSRRMRPLRHLVFQCVILVIACGSLFDAPDTPVFSVSRLSGILAFWLILNIIAYGNIYLLFPVFLRRGKQRLYMISVGLFITILTAVCAVIQIVTYEPSHYLHPLPYYIMAVSTIGSMLTLGLFLGGTASLLAIKEWVMGEQRLTRLHAETSRCELQYLRKQVNPHFLFNVLNNTGVLVYENPGLARKVLGELRRLLGRQLSQTRRAKTKIREEVEFLGNYLSLEAMRFEPLEYVIDSSPEVDDIEIPTLLFIPFVENAVKHGGISDGRREIKMGFSMDDGWLCFECRNTCNHSRRIKASSASSGLGLSNLRRRLELLYSDNFRLHQAYKGTEYLVNLQIPV